MKVGGWVGVALALVVAASGCCPTHPEAGCGASSANVSVSGPAALGLAPTVPLASVRSCVDSAGKCSDTPGFTLDTLTQGTGLAPKPGATGARLVLNVSFPPTTAGGTTLALPSPDVQAQGGLDTYPPLDVSGTIVVESAGPSGFQLSLQLQLATNDGQTITVSGPVSASGCGLHQVHSQCGQSI
jgi:hypothetical protein